MKEKHQGFLIRSGDKFRINGKVTSSILLNQLQVDLLNHFKMYFRGRLLDVGCGEKPYSLLYDELVDSSIGVDVETCVHNKNFIDVFASAADLPFDDASFDTVLCSNVLEHVSEAGKGFKEIGRVLKNEGYFIGIVPFLYPVHEAPYDFYRYTPYGVRFCVEKQGMEVIHLIPLGGGGLMLFVYWNLFISRLLKWKATTAINIAVQNIFYKIYKKISFKRILEGGGNISRTISCGYLVIAKK